MATMYAGPRVIYHRNDVCAVCSCRWSIPSSLVTLLRYISLC